ncbi:MAG: sugar kinase [Armatimonadetes bacterium CG2_30_59_28]|nr:sugar kinase [Armatimonadota bacterium]OIO89848.1 MAG: sugar kinase [Armatimonadetes bacterium CG2_30_59_28]PIU64195.1 MAG: sugar kinase [Armatimonadetes bacterium CG07_land_8_20_14_0_80_59_28]PIY48103.1 MAG: sugar kinase [Armatimonadetes bacterium CG_4_10_14_3_um_filter_59_10]
MSVLIVGSIAFDTVETPFGKVEDALGGAATYASCAASLFSNVQMVGVVGTDFPEEHLEVLRSKGIDTEGIERTEGKTFRWGGYYDFDLNQAHTRYTQLNVFENFNPIIPDSYRDPQVLFLANIHPALQLKILDQVGTPKLTLCDTMNLWIDTTRDELLRVLERVDVALMNDAEARQLCETWSLITAGKRVLEMGPRIAIIKKGEHGALMFARTSGGSDSLKFFAAPSYPLEELRDPTGAGDCFAGGLCGYLDYTGDFSLESFRKAIVYGSIVASYNVEDFSVERLKWVSPEDIATRYNEFMLMTRFE